jgi:hypothetical protein
VTNASLLSGANIENLSGELTDDDVMVENPGDDPTMEIKTGIVMSDVIVEDRAQNASVIVEIPGDDPTVEEKTDIIMSDPILEDQIMDENVVVVVVVDDAPRVNLTAEEIHESDLSNTRAQSPTVEMTNATFLSEGDISNLSGAVTGNSVVAHAPVEDSDAELPTDIVVSDSTFKYDTTDENVVVGVIHETYQPEISADDQSAGVTNLAFPSEADIENWSGEVSLANNIQEDQSDDVTNETILMEVLLITSGPEVMNNNDTMLENLTVEVTNETPLDDILCEDPTLEVAQKPIMCDSPSKVSSADTMKQPILSPDNHLEFHIPAH